jgi:hypothetical protein
MDSDSGAGRSYQAKAEPRYGRRVTDADEAETLARIDVLARSLPNADEPYWIAVDVASAASDALVTSLIACDLYQLWTGLTDWYELKPNDRPAAVAAMCRAATGWADVKDKPAARKAYFKSWSDELSQLALGEAGQALGQALPRA